MSDQDWNSDPEISGQREQKAIPKKQSTSQEQKSKQIQKQTLKNLKIQNQTEKQPQNCLNKVIPQSTQQKTVKISQNVENMQQSNNQQEIILQKQIQQSKDKADKKLQTNQKLQNDIGQASFEDNRKNKDQQEPQLDVSWSLQENQTLAKQRQSSNQIVKDQIQLSWNNDIANQSNSFPNSDAFRKKKNSDDSNPINFKGGRGNGISSYSNQQNQSGFQSQGGRGAINQGGRGNINQGGRGTPSSDFRNDKWNDRTRNFQDNNQPSTGFGRGGVGRGRRDFGDSDQQNDNFRGGRGGRGRGGFQRNQGGRGYGNRDEDRFSNREEGGYGRSNRGGRGGGFGRGRNGNFNSRDDDFDNRSRDRDSRRQVGAPHFDRQQNTNKNFGYETENNFKKKPNTQNSQNPKQTSVQSPIQANQTILNFNDISMIEAVPKKIEINEKKSDFRINKTMACQPIGLKCWPSVSIYIRRTKVSVYMSRINDHICSVLFFPYTEYNLDLYPGNIINQSPFNYKKKLKQKAKPQGEVYFQKSVGIKNFNALAFTKFEKDGSSDIKKIMKDLISMGSKLGTGIDTILIPYSQKLGSMKDLGEGILQGLQDNMKYSEIIISTNEPSDFIKASQQFLEIIKQLAESNEIVIQ